MGEPAGIDAKFGGLVDDVRTAIRWQPILPMLEELEKAEGVTKKAEKLKKVFEFAIARATGRDPYKMQAFFIFAKFVELLKQDKEWAQIVADPFVEKRR